MLNEVLNELNNYFIGDSSFGVDVTFTTTDTLTGDFADVTFQVGQYIIISGSKLNDGVYKIATISDTTIAIDATVDLVIDTESEATIELIQCAIPKLLVALIADIKTFTANSADGISGESQGGRSVSYTSDGWKGAFNSRLDVYKKLRWS